MQEVNYDFILIKTSLIPFAFAALMLSWWNWRVLIPLSGGLHKQYTQSLIWYECVAFSSSFVLEMDLVCYSEYTKWDGCENISVYMSLSSDR